MCSASFSNSAPRADVLRQNIPIVRFVDHSLTTRMSEWICMQCLNHLRQQKHYDGLQKKADWADAPQPQASDVNIGVMGLGVLGQDAAHKLKTLGFNVLGWSRTLKEIEGVDCYDQNGLDQFLEQCHYLVGLLKRQHVPYALYLPAAYLTAAFYQ